VLIALSTLALLIWLYLLLFRAGFWQMNRYLLPKRRANHSCTVAAIIPARNEADVIDQSIRSLLAQDFSGSLHLFVVDDDSSDATVQIALQAAKRAGAAERLTIVPSLPLPAGWTGKVWAMQQGWQVARSMNPDCVLLSDADIAHPRDNLARLVEQAESQQRDLVSIMVHLRCETVAEKLLIPAFVYFFFLLYPPRQTSQPRSGVAGAAGGCMLVRASTLESIAGFESIRGEIIDDCSLAAQVKRCGGKLWLGLSNETRSLRGYVSFGELRAMIARTAFSQLRHSAWRLAACVLAMLLVFIVPVALLWSRNLAIQIEAAIALGFMLRSYLPAIRLYRLNLANVLTLPLAAVFYIYATIWSAVSYWRGRGGQWKGRAQDHQEIKGC
jgi:hopene-associated glycosyltransferase HpnB